MILDDTSLILPPGQKGVVTASTVSASVKSVVEQFITTVSDDHHIIKGRIVAEQNGQKDTQLFYAHRVSKDTWVATWIGKDFSRPGASWGVEGAVSW